MSIFRSSDNRFIFYCFQSNIIKNQIHEHLGATINQITNRNLSSFQIPFPTREERDPIGETLSDAEGLIDAIEELIVKKRAIKQATMQSLLTGKPRLPGYSGEWETGKLGDIVAIRNNKVLPSDVDSDTLCVELDHVGQSNGRLLKHSTARVSVSSKYRFSSGDVLFGRLRSYLRKYWHTDCDGVCTTEIWPLMARPGQTDDGFLYGIVQTERFIDAASISYGTHMLRADWSVIWNLEIPLPKNREQRAIAAVFCEIDAEISALERWREKCRGIMQRMVEQLLTARIRLTKAKKETEQEEVAVPVARKHNWQFNEAILISVLVRNFGTEQYPLGRKRYTKLLYLYHRHEEGRTEGYLKKAAGPYNPRVRYGGPEGIAVEKKS